MSMKCNFEFLGECDSKALVIYIHLYTINDTVKNCL